MQDTHDDARAQAAIKAFFDDMVPTLAQQVHGHYDPTLNHVTGQLREAKRKITQLEGQIKTLQAELKASAKMGGSLATSPGAPLARAASVF
jgi:hypothetical protein